MRVRIKIKIKKVKSEKKEVDEIKKIVLLEDPTCTQLWVFPKYTSG